MKIQDYRRPEEDIEMEKENLRNQMDSLTKEQQQEV